MWKCGIFANKAQIQSGVSNIISWETDIIQMEVAAVTVALFSTL